MTKIGLAQFDIQWENVGANIATLGTMLADHQPGAFDILVLPELWTCGFTMNHEAHKTFATGLAFMRDVAARFDCVVIGGLPAQTATGQQNRCYRVGKGTEEFYAKIKTFKFAGEHLKYESGQEVTRWAVAGFQISPFVCYDLRFPELARRVMPQSDLLIYVANWPTPRVHHWRHLLVSRAIENLCYVVGVNRIGIDGKGLHYSGGSRLVGPAGDVLFDGEDRAGIHIVNLDPAEVTATRAKWPFLADM